MTKLADALFLRNHPKQAAFSISSRLITFVLKKVMFNLNEDNRIVMAQHPTDMLMGVNGMLLTGP